MSYCGRWRCGEQGPHTGLCCRHRKNAVAHMPEGWSSRLWYAPFGAIPLFRRLSLFVPVWYSYSKFIHFIFMWECKAADMKFPFLAFYSQPFSRPQQVDRSILQSFGLYGSCVGERTRVPFPFCFIDAFKPKSPPCIFSEKFKYGDNNNKKGALISSWPLSQ